MSVELDAVFEALADPTRRDIFERIVIRPRRIVDLSADAPVSRPAVSQAVRFLRDADLVCERGGALHAIAETLPFMRLYFDRLWLEASLGDAWLSRRRLETQDFGL
jgi:DNA-binding transcriptional ArsR family regulator